MADVANDAAYLLAIHAIVDFQELNDSFSKPFVSSLFEYVSYCLHLQEHWLISAYCCGPLLLSCFFVSQVVSWKVQCQG